MADRRPDSVDEGDRELIRRLRAELEAHDPAPPAVVAAAKASFSWLTVDADLAALVEDSLAASGAAASSVRSAAGPRMLTFECATGLVTVEVTVVGELRRLLGHMDRPARVTLRHGTGERVVDTDPHGRFRFDEIESGPVSLRCDVVGHEVPMITSWVVV